MRPDALARKLSIRYVAQWIVLGLASLWLLAALAIVAVRWIDPPTTMVHMQRRFQAWIKQKQYTERYRFVPLKQISPDFQHAVIAAEDARFYQHHGIDTRSLMRVLFKSILLQNESSGGGSTITQQLAKNLFPRKNYHILSLPINKIREIIVASRIEDLYDKQSIITLYLNTIPFGDNTFGIEAAAQRFFSTFTICFPVGPIYR